MTRKIAFFEHGLGRECAPKLKEDIDKYLKDCNSVIDSGMIRGDNSILFYLITK